MKQKSNRHIIDVLFVIGLFSIFALSAVFLITIGADIYRKTITHMDENFNTRTSLAYLTEKIRQSDRADGVSLGSLEEHPALILHSETDDTSYRTYIYETDGMLQELMVRDDLTLSASAGQPILEVQAFTLTRINSHLLKCSIRTDDESCEFYLSVHAGGLHDEND